ncbi:hypothetical protein BWQ96_06266 [Gracilariopsis chorda]|uniref:Uncharacterized protein n=1 Tax=Gracilariopsis chorda TaxID=448386 RepID=A0A2V3IPE3_9FLOR|nr:hypothetical protein BWQ96_06266 [Gracilariopsis chorda]|eukprot:PXF43956.1 hypothetical protein BWQ96_06266 [Gracilariopsis chorda]
MISKKPGKQAVENEKFIGTSRVEGYIVSIHGESPDKKSQDIKTSSSSDRFGLKNNNIIGSKRTYFMENQVKVLEQGAEGIEELAGAAKKRNVVAEQFLAVEKQWSLFTLFSLPEIYPRMRQRYPNAMAQSAIKEVGNKFEVQTQADIDINSMSYRKPNSSSFMQADRSESGTQKALGGAPPPTILRAGDPPSAPNQSQQPDRLRSTQ